uniref:HERV-H LTR-associating protein 1 n=1 Tax=Sus scrofa TaxID=9823 RepID=A0A8D1JJV2_PIG
MLSLTKLDSEASRAMQGWVEGSTSTLNPSPFPVSGLREEERRENRITYLDTTGENYCQERAAGGISFESLSELPARSVDLSALNLTELVNGMLSRALKDSKKFFSLLSITSYSSFAFHKFSVAIYNSTSVTPALKNPHMIHFSLNFTALLVDIIGNSTSYLTEIFKSTSILSVSQTNASDCIFICVMTGKSGRNLSDLWEMAEKSPVINYTYTSSMSGVLATGGMALTSQLTPTSQQTLPWTSPPRGAQSTGVSALRTSPGTEATLSSEREQTVNTNPLPELDTRATVRAATSLDSASPPLPASATRMVAGTTWATAHRPSWASTQERIPGGPPWETPSFPPTSPAEAEEAVNTRSLSRLPAGTVASPSSPAQTGLTSGSSTASTQTPSPTKAPAPKYPQTGRNLALEREAQDPRGTATLGAGGWWGQRWCPAPLLGEGTVTATPLPLAIRKLNPCLMELCRFFQQCLCMSQSRDPRMEAVRYCLDYYSWFLRNATYICQRARRVFHSHSNRSCNLCCSHNCSNAGSSPTVPGQD